jgi:very-short-patch-repair endonuclease
LSQQYPYDQIFEEVYVLGENLYLDFFIPSLKLVVEVNGRQHETFVPHFHGTKRDFILQQQRDRRKAEWCLKNGFEFRVYTEGDIRNGVP